MIIMPPHRETGEIPAAYCTQCGGEIYRGEDYYRIDGQEVCTDCLAGFAEEYFRFCRVEGETGYQT